MNTVTYIAMDNVHVHGSVHVRAGLCAVSVLCSVHVHV
jgi:hypothetical protein